MISKRQNNFALVCVGFVIGFVSGYKYGSSHTIKKNKNLKKGGNISPCDPEPEPRIVEPEPESEPRIVEPEPELRIVEPYGDPESAVNYFSTSYADTYARLDELVKKPPEVVQSTADLSFRQKYALMEDYSYIISMSYSQACRIVSTKGYTLRVSSVQGFSQKLPSDTYSSTTFGVEIQDPNYNFQTNSPSKDALIASIINIGPVTDNIGHK